MAKKTIEELQAKRAENIKAQQAILDLSEAEKRSLSAEEKDRFDALQSEIDTIERSIKLSNGAEEIQVKTRIHEIAEGIRSLIRRESNELRLKFRTTATMMTPTDVAGAIGQHVAGIVGPLEGNLVFGLLKMTMPTNMKWNQKWATVSSVTATIEDVDAVLSETEISVSALNPSPKRCAIQIPVSNAAIEASDVDLVQGIIMPQATKAFQWLLNKWMMDTSAYQTGCSGPFVSPGSSITFASAVPTYAELQKMRGSVEGAGVRDDGTYAYIMHPLMAAALKSTPKGGTGGDRMILENGEIDGVKVFITADIEQANSALATKGPKFVGFGRWSDWMCGQFGDLRIAIDNQSKAAAGADMTYFTLNTYFAQNAIRSAAFCLGTATLPA